MYTFSPCDVNISMACLEKRHVIYASKMMDGKHSPSREDEGSRGLCRPCEEDISDDATTRFRGGEPGRRCMHILVDMHINVERNPESAFATQEENRASHQPDSSTPGCAPWTGRLGDKLGLIRLRIFSQHTQDVVAYSLKVPSILTSSARRWRHPAICHPNIPRSACTLGPHSIPLGPLPSGRLGP